VPRRDTSICGGDILYFTSGPYSVHTDDAMLYSSVVIIIIIIIIITTLFQS